MRHEGNGSNGMMAAFVLGSLAGGITALLFAPSSGRRLRRSLARGGRKLRRQALSSAESIQERSQALLDRASESLNDIAGDARELASLRARR